MKTARTRTLMKMFLFNPQVKFEYPITAISNQTKSLIAFIDLSKTGEEAEDFENPFGIIKTDVLLNVIDNIDEPEIEIDETDIIISNDKIKQKIRKSPANIFIDVNKDSLGLVENTFDLIGEVQISEEEFKDILKRAKILGHDTMVIEKDKIITGKENGNELEDESEIKIENDMNDKIVLNLNEVLKLPMIDYKFKFFTNGDIKLGIIYPIDFPEVKIVISEKIQN